MNVDASVTMGFSIGLTAAEQAKVEEIDSEVARVLFCDRGISERPVWHAAESHNGRREILLSVAGQTEALFVLGEFEFSFITSEEIIDAIRFIPLR